MSVPVCVMDIGGTKLAAGVMLADNTIHYRHELPTLAHEGADAVLQRLIALGTQVLATYQQAHPAAPVAAIGVASGGQIEPTTGQVVHATDNIPGWTGLPLGAQLAAHFQRPTFVENDANCFALAEAQLGAGQGHRHLLVVAVGTGVGAGIVINGRLYSGWQGKAGEVGHICVEPLQGRPCTCGLAGCLESYTATRIIVAESGYPSIQALAEAYRAGQTLPVVDAAARWLGRGLASLAHVIGPEALIVGGSVGLLGERYLGLVQQSYHEHAMRSYRAIPVLAAQLAADTGLLGAGLWARQEWT
ncbi:MAG: ROK family protein [Caldilineaceae bacterium]|nr:ROK family protein [Caldilineaceae bacterium]